MEHSLILLTTLNIEIEQIESENDQIDEIAYEDKHILTLQLIKQIDSGILIEVVHDQHITENVESSELSHKQNVEGTKGTAFLLIIIVFENGLEHHQPEQHYLSKKDELIASTQEMGEQVGQ